MTDPAKAETKKHFIEEVALVFEMWGLTRTAGRIMGWLMVCDPPHQSAGQLADATGASKGSVSTATRTLINTGLVERIGIPGERSSFYRLTRYPGATLMAQKLSGLVIMRKLAERGLAIVADGSPEQREQLRRMRDMWEFFEREMPLLIQKYEQEFTREDAP